MCCCGLRWKIICITSFWTTPLMCLYRNILMTYNDLALILLKYHFLVLVSFEVVVFQHFKLKIEPRFIKVCFKAEVIEFRFPKRSRVLPFKKIEFVVVALMPMNGHTKVNTKRNILETIYFCIVLYTFATCVLFALQCYLICNYSQF